MSGSISQSSPMLQLAVPGSLLSTNVESFRVGALAAIERLSQESLWAGIEIDLTRAEMVDSAGLNALVSVIRKLNSRGRKTRIRVHDAHVHRTCLFTRLDQLAPIVRT
jgi:anti-anti-sigma factor